MSRARRFTFGGLAVAVAALVANGSAILPAAADPPTQWVNAGTLTLRTGGTDSVTFDNGTPTQTADDLTQTLGNTNSCDLKTSGAALLGFTGKAGNVTKPVGFLNDSIGVNERLPELCYKVDTLSLAGPETLELSLGSALVNFADPPRRLLATAASLDLEVRSYLTAKAKIQATAWLDSAQVGDVVELVAGSPACPALKDNDNCRLNIAPGGRFNRLTLTVVKGSFPTSFSLEGGSDIQTPPTASSTFTLVSEVDAFFDCTVGQTLTEGNVSVTFRGVPGPDPCQGFGVVLRAGDREVEFLKPLNVSNQAQFIFDIDWRLPKTTPTPDATLPQPEIDFEESAVENFRKMPFCPASLYNGSGQLVGVQDDDPSDLPDWVGTLTGNQYACVGKRSADVVPASVTIHDKIFLIGDAKMRM